MRQLLGFGAIVGKEHEPFGIRIQPADVIHIAVAGWNQLVDGAFRALGYAAAHKAARFVHQKHHFFLRLDMVPVHFHEIAGLHADAGDVDRTAIDLHAAFSDQAVGGAARFIAARGEELVETYAAFGDGMFGRGFFRHDV